MEALVECFEYLGWNAAQLLQFLCLRSTRKAVSSDLLNPLDMHRV